jgi:hypothetical protein
MSQSSAINEHDSKTLVKLALQQFPLRFKKLPASEQDRVWGEVTNRFLNTGPEHWNGGRQYVQVTDSPSVSMGDAMIGALPEFDYEELEQLYFELFAFMAGEEDDLTLFARLAQKE